jgi:tRNA U34 5-methylaminomethyl-2-thiouridine-forming methyltransferase MnmC
MKLSDKLKERYRLVETEDGSITLFSIDFNEACHSTSGAVEETKLHYLRGCEVKEGSRILEIGFGLGIGFEVTREHLQDFCFVSVEIDGELVDWAIKERGLEDQRLQVIVGDARETLKNYQGEKFDCIYQDAFSPRRNPELWTVEWFQMLREYSKPSVRLSTYSASTSIRKSLIEAGWSVQEGAQFGPKRAATIAGLDFKTSQEILDKLERSPAVALTEANIDEYRKIN